MCERSASRAPESPPSGLAQGMHRGEASAPMEWFEAMPLAMRLLTIAALKRAKTDGPPR